jgi:hypothetical protein
MRSGLPSIDSMNIKIIRMFWTSSRVQFWEDTIFSNGTEVVHVSLPIVTHTKERIKAPELSPDNRRLKIGFVWFPLHQNSSYVDVFECPLMPAGLKHSPNNIKLWNVETEQILRAGDEIWLKTDDPVLMPPPDRIILDAMGSPGSGGPKRSGGSKCRCHR